MKSQKTEKQKSNLYSGLIVDVVWPSGFSELTELLVLEDVVFDFIFGQPKRIQKMWRVRTWNRKKQEWSTNSQHLAIFLLETCRVVSPLEKLLIIGG